MLGSALLERDRVGGEAVVANVAQVPERAVPIGDGESAVGEAVDEVVQLHGHLVVVQDAARAGNAKSAARLWHRRSSWTRAKKIPQVRIVERRGGCSGPRLALSAPSSRLTDVELREPLRRAVDDEAQVLLLSTATSSRSRRTESSVRA